MTVQLAFPSNTWPCDICAGTGIETDKETQTARRCRVCEGLGTLDHDPAIAQEDPFAGLGGAA